jgi:hypothetical protein
MNKDIFRYFDGAVYRFADPLKIDRDLFIAAGCPINVLIEKSKNQDSPEGKRAEGAWIECVRAAFEMKPFDILTGEGATEDDCRRAWQDYTAFLEKKNQNPEPPPPSSTPTPESTPAQF